MRRHRRRRLVAWTLLGLGAWVLWRLARTPAAAPVAPAAAPADPVEVPVRAAAPGHVVARRPRPSSLRRGQAGVRPAVIAAVALVMLVVGVAAALGVRGGDLVGGDDARVAPVASLRVGDRTDLSTAAVWAPVLRPAQALTRPEKGAPAVGRIGRRTPEGAPNLVMVAAGSGGDGGWVRVRLAGPSGAEAGWVRRAVLGEETTVESHLFIDLAARRLTLVRRGRVALQAPAGVGTPGAPSPAGEFYVRSRLTRYASAFYGPFAFGLSAPAPGLTDWPARGFVGIHGTNRPQLVPGAVSRGSIWLRNPDLRRLARLMPLGTPVTIG